jgi:acetate kinase
MGGIDGLIFTAGIGERSAEIRARVLHRLRWLGFSLDESANHAGGPLLTDADSRHPAYVILTDEELVIARHALALIGQA